MGDGLLVYFGYPQAHEDDAERAVRAGLGIVDCVGQLEIRDEIELELVSGWVQRAVPMKRRAVVQDAIVWFISDELPKTSNDTRLTNTRFTREQD